MRNKLHYIDKLWVGIAVGIICPFICFLIAFFIVGNENSFSIFWYNFTQDAFTYDYKMNTINNELKKNILILCLILNLLVFYIGFFTLKYDKFTKGIVFITLLLVGLAYLFIY